jgi:amino acid permease
MHRSAPTNTEWHSTDAAAHYRHRQQHRMAAGTMIDGNESKRQGTISSARLNLLSSMVGGGCLSLPLAFHQTGNIFVGPIILIVTAVLAHQSILFLIKAGVYSTTSSGTDEANNTESRRNDILGNRKGVTSYENVASHAFGPKARICAMALVCICCYFAAVGYAVLLRDMLEPIVDAIVTPAEGVGGGPTFARNAAMLLIILCISPLTTWRNLTALKDVGAASMAAVLTVGLCVAYRSIECQMGVGEDNSSKIEDVDGSMRAFPPSMKELLDALPLFVSSYVCHFNVLPIHNELKCPSSDRVKHWVRTTIWPATLFYYVIGLSGSMFVKCTASGSVQGNILLDFDEDDQLLLLGRLCLAMTITLAFPMVVIPARDIIVRSLRGSSFGMREHQSALNTTTDDVADLNELTIVDFEPIDINNTRNNLEEPLLVLEHQSVSTMSMAGESDEFNENNMQTSSTQLRDGDADSKVLRSIVALLVFWSAAGVACSVQSIDVVWDLVGSSFSIMMAFLIPCGAYLKLSRRRRFALVQGGRLGYRKWMVSRSVAWMMILIFVPLMVISTLNACYNSFFSNSR